MTEERTARSFPLPKGQAFALAVLCGVLYWLSFPSHPARDKCGLLAFVAFVPFFFAIRGQTPKVALLLGLAAGTTMNALGFYWLNEMLQKFSGFPAPICALFVLIISSYQGGRMALMGWLAARAEKRGHGFYLVAPLAFIGSEVIFPVLFFWYFGASAHTMPIFTQVADIGGPILVGLVLLCGNLAIFEGLVSKFEGRAGSAKHFFGALLPVGLAGLYGAYRIHAVDSEAARAEPALVGVIQGNLELLQKREDPAEGLRRHIRLSDEMRKKGADFLVWSESSVTMPVDERQAPRFLRDRVGKRLGLPAVFGAVLYRLGADRERWFNTAVSTTKEGEVISRYDKHFLLAFGEYLPFGDDFPILYKWSPNSGRFSKGDKLDPLLLTVRGVQRKVTALICYEDILPGFTNDAVRTAGDPDLLVNITNDAWFGDTAEPWEHFALAKLRAVEHHRYLVRSTNSGVSGVVDPVGRTIALSGTYREQALLSEIRWMKGRTPFESLGFLPWYAAALASVVLAFRGGLKANPAPKAKSKS